MAKKRTRDLLNTCVCTAICDVVQAEGGGGGREREREKLRARGVKIRTNVRKSNKGRTTKEEQNKNGR